MSDAEALESASFRAAVLAQAWAERPSPEQPYHWAGPAGNVTLRAVQTAVEGALTYVRVWVGEGPEDDLQGPAHFKIVNPPGILVRPDGSWLGDPLAALCATIASTSRATARKVKR